MELEEKIKELKDHFDGDVVLGVYQNREDDGEIVQSIYRKIDRNTIDMDFVIVKDLDLNTGELLAQTYYEKEKAIELAHQFFILMIKFNSENKIVN